MKELSTLRLLAPLGIGALVFLVSPACHDYDDDDDDYGGHSSPPIFFEVEPNNDAFTANDFGFLAPGDHFIIEGYITDSGLDPFDGFWFTSTQPIHVDFQLFIDDPFTDLDVCLYDPVADVTIDCYQSANNPEQGGIDVTGPNIDFHLVVESFVGASTYGLEIVVLPLAPALTAEGGASAAPAASLRAVKPINVVDKSVSTNSFGSYGTAEKAVIRSHFEVDEELGLVIETTTVERVPVDREQKSVKVR